MENLKKQNLLSFIILLLLGMALSAMLKNENPFDFANYHYYNAFAFINDRSELDVIPCSVNTFFNPLIELPLYFYINYFNDSPDIVYALQGIGSGLFLFMLYKICLLFFGENRKKSALLVLALTITGQATFSQIGASTNEVTIGFFILCGWYILLKMIKFPDQQRWHSFFLAGLVMGVGLGLKQTVITYCIASGLTLMICSKYLKNPLKSISWFAMGGLIGYLIINGYFMYKYWILYSNPFFPFLNGIFNSPYFFNFNFQDTRNLPSLSQFLIYPFLWNITRNISEILYFDFRLTLYYVIPPALFLILWQKKQLKFFCRQYPLLTTNVVFCFLSILIWMALFSIMRYAVIIEAVGAVITVGLLDKYNHKKHFIAFCGHLSIIAFLLSLFLIYPRWGHVEKHIDLPEINLPDNSLLKLHDQPTSFLIPIIAQNRNIKTATYYPRCTNYPQKCALGDGTDFAEYGPFRERRNLMEQNHTGPIIYIFSREFSLIFETMEDIKNICEQYEKSHIIKDSQKCLHDFMKKHRKSTEKIQKLKDSGYYCERLQNNISKYLAICVPEELKEQILPHLAAQ